MQCTHELTFTYTGTHVYPLICTLRGTHKLNIYGHTYAWAHCNFLMHSQIGISPCLQLSIVLRLYIYIFMYSYTQCALSRMYSQAEYLCTCVITKGVHIRCTHVLCSFKHCTCKNVLITVIITVSKYSCTHCNLQHIQNSLGD